MALSLTYKGFNYVDYFNGDYSDYDTLSGVESTGADSVALTPDFGIDVADSTIYAGGATTDTTADLTLAIDDAAEDGLTSFVRPLIDFLYPQASPTYPGNYYVPDADSGDDPSGYIAANVPQGATPAIVPAGAYSDGDAVNYRGELSPNDIDTTKFFGSATTAGSYDYMIVQEAEVAQAAGAKLFSVGTELDSLANDDNLTGDWDTLIADARAVFTGKLTYSANWATASQVTFWNRLDFVGIDGYVPLSNTIPTNAAQNPTLASLDAGWNTVSDVDIAFSNPATTVGTQLGGLSAIDAFDTLAQQSIDKQFLFTEIGYQNDTSAAADPTGSSNKSVTDPTLQAELYSAFFDAWGSAQATAAADGGDVDGIPYSLAGAYFWNWNPDTSASGYDDWSPVGYPAQAVIDAGFGTTSGPVVVAETGVAGVAGYEGTPSPAVGTAGTSGTGALAGDSDATSSTLTITAVSANGVAGAVGADGGAPSFLKTQYGSLALNSDGSYRYFAGGGTSALASAPTGAPVADVIDFTVSDGNGATANSTLAIKDYRDPTAVAETATVVAGGTLDATAGTEGTGVLRGDSDPDGVMLTNNVLSQLGEPETNPDVAKYGALTLNSDGSYSYVSDSPTALAAAFAADSNAPLEDSFAVDVLGGDGTFAISTLTVAVTSNDFTGGGYSIALIGFPDATVYLYSTDGAWDTVTGSAGDVDMTSAQAVVTGGGDTVDFVGGSGDAVTLSATGGVWDIVNGSLGTIYLASAQAVVTGGGDTFDFYSGTGNAATLSATGGVWDIVSGSGGELYLDSAQAVVTGGGDTVDFYSGSGNAATLSATGGVWDIVNGSSGTLYLASAQAVVTGGDDTVDFYSGSGNAATLSATGGVWDIVSGSGGSLYLASAQAVVTGGDDTVDFYSGSSNAATLSATGGVWDIVNGSGGELYLDGAQAVVTGGDDTVDFYSGSGNAATLSATGGVWDIVNGSGGTIYLASAQAVVTGGGDTVDFYSGSGNAATLSATGGVWDIVNGSSGTLYLASAQAVVTGGGDTVDFYSGSGNAATLSATGGVWDIVNGSSGTLYLASAQAVVTGGGDTVDFYSGSGNAATLSGTAGVWDTANGSGGTLYLANAQAAVTGDDVVYLEGSTVTQSGASDAFVFQRGFGEDIVNGFASTDTMQFSASEFANSAALDTHISQSGANTSITLDASNQVTLTDVTATSLVSSQFRFA